MIHIIDTKHPWTGEFEAACKRRGVDYALGTPDGDSNALIFFAVNQYPPNLRERQQALAASLPLGNRYIQDLQQIEFYEDKQAQMEQFGAWMPESHIFTDREAAEAYAGDIYERYRFPAVSKSREGSSSHNIRILQTRADAKREIEAIWSDRGLKLHTQPGWQKGYWLVQEFIPHNITFRVTIVGSKIHVYKRFCYPDKAVAAPARVVPTEPVNYADPVMQDLLAWSAKVFEDIGTKFCAIDVLYDHQRQKWVLLETSLAWARGDDPAANSKFFDSKWSLNQQWDLLLDEIEAGVFGDEPAPKIEPYTFQDTGAPLHDLVHRVPKPRGSLAVVCWLWDNTAPDSPTYAPQPMTWREKRDRRKGAGPFQPREGRPEARKYLPEHVNALARQFKKYLTVPHRFICIADSPEGLSDVEHLETPAAARALAKLPSPEGARFPSCYRRLWTWSDEAVILGDRVLLVDIDTLLLGNIDHLVDNDEDFIGWEPKMGWGSKHRVMGALYLMRTGAFPQVWTAFNGARAIQRAARAGYRGSDQAWLGYMLGPNAPVWPDSAGIYSIRDLEKSNDPPPKDARLIQFNGPRNPWHFTATEKPSWVAEAWQKATAPDTIAGPTEVNA